MKYGYFTNCINWPAKDVYTLHEMIDNAVDITRQTFMKHVSKSEMETIAHNLGYAKHPKQGLTMAGDYHVSYHRSKLNDKRVYYFCHSAIEYIFTRHL